MFYIPVILGSTRNGRQSPKVAHYVVARLKDSGKINPELIDLLEWDLPMMKERLRFLENPPASVKKFGEKIAAADALVIVSPEYNHGYPGVLKNALDYLLPEYKRKPVGIATVSAGYFGGINCLTQLRLSLFGMGALPIPVSLQVPKVKDAFDEHRNVTKPEIEKSADRFIHELLWYTEAIYHQKQKEQKPE